MVGKHRGEKYLIVASLTFAISSQGILIVTYGHLFSNWKLTQNNLSVIASKSWMFSFISITDLQATQFK